MDKKKILIVYPLMMMGGSTTSLLSLLHNIDKEKYEVDLLLYRNTGDLLSEIPDDVRLLPATKKYGGRFGKLVKVVILIFSGYLFKGFFANRKKGKKGCSNAVLEECQAKYFSRKVKQQYDYAISFLEGWSNRYLAFNVNADKKYAWIHSTFSKTTDDVKFEKRWIEKVDKVVFVTDACKNEFDVLLPEYADKSIIVANIIDSTVIRKRALLIENDESYNNFVNNKKTKIVTVCRITINTKGLDRIVDTVKNLKADGYEFLWYIIGDGPDKSSLDELISKADVSDCLVTVGQKMNPYPFIKEADFMCMPSRYEGKPMVVTESMILGVPAVVTEYLSAHDQIKHGVEGLVLSNNDNSLYSALKALISDKETINKMKKYLSENEYGNGEYIEYIQKELFF
ncbi:MAG: glycosyltransferase [Clostridia bacterium]|nr:glycosyltransferase [Clostridia bacterium]